MGIAKMQRPIDEHEHAPLSSSDIAARCSLLALSTDKACRGAPANQSPTRLRSAVDEIVPPPYDHMAPLTLALVGPCFCSRSGVRAKAKSVSGSAKVHSPIGADADDDASGTFFGGFGSGEKEREREKKRQEREKETLSLTEWPLLLCLGDKSCKGSLRVVWAMLHTAISFQLEP